MGAASEGQEIVRLSKEHAEMKPIADAVMALAKTRAEMADLEAMASDPEMAEMAREEIAAHAWCENGPSWRGVMLRSAEQVLAVRPDTTVLAGLEIGLVGPQPAGSDTAFEVRAFFHTLQTLSEDPVTGSLNAAVAQWLIGAGLAPPRYLAAQGTAMGRAGRVHIERDAGGTIWVGGASVTCIAGEVSL